MKEKQYSILCYDGKDGKFLFQKFIYNTVDILNWLKLGYAVEVHVSVALANYQDDHIRTDGDGFAFPTNQK